MTDISKIDYYYSRFNEWNRLESGEGRLEFETVIEIIKQHLPVNSTVLDLGGGPGRHTATLSGLGYQMYLADLSPTLISIAQEKVKQFGNPGNVIQMDVCNALDLSRYGDKMFDAVLLFGPLYHLTSEKEITTCLSETQRVLKKGGKLFAIYIPKMAGLTGVLERSFYAPAQVNSEILLKTYTNGIFNNLSNEGFQEGSYIETSIMLNYFVAAGFNKLLLRSIRGIGNKLAENILSLQQSNPEYFQTILKIINDTSTDSAVIETCGHAVFVGEKM